MSKSHYRIHIAQAVLDDLKERLSKTRWPDEIADSGWDYGSNLAYLKELVAYWQDQFDWRAQETALNKFANFRAEVNGVGIHFVHEQGTGDSRIPLLMMHGWPSTFYQMHKIIPMLVDSAQHRGTAGDSFDVIAPSLPGFGFSDKPSARGMSVAAIARLFHKLMTEVLGYERYALRSSDLGAGVATQLCIMYPDAIIGAHTSGTNPYIGQVPENLTPAEQEFVRNAQTWNQQEMAYAFEHSSKPQTLAYGLNDSPAGLAAWIVEKFRRWSDCGGNLEARFSKDELLTNLTIYWVTETINSSMRLYYETARDPGQWGALQTPIAVIMPEHDMFPTPREWFERSGPVARWTPAPRGGHFLEWEEPEFVANDLRAFFAPMRKTS